MTKIKINDAVFEIVEEDGDLIVIAEDESNDLRAEAMSSYVDTYIDYRSPSVPDSFQFVALGLVNRFGGEIVEHESSETEYDENAIY